MANIKEYNVELENDEVCIVIDHDVWTDEKLHEINNFWCDEESRLSDADDDIGQAVAGYLAATCLSLQIQHYGLNNYGVMKQFDWDERNGGVEGWPKMDGSQGILIRSCSEPTFEISNMSFSVNTLDAMPAPPKSPNW